MTHDRDCARCGEPEYSDEQIALIEADETEELISPERLLYQLFPSREHVCWECMTLVERRTENNQCARCGAEYYDDEGNEPANWITSSMGRTCPYLCPDCQTDAEARAAAAEFVAYVERGKRLGNVHETDLDLMGLAEGAQQWLWARERETDELKRALEEGQ